MKGPMSVVLLYNYMSKKENGSTFVSIFIKAYFLQMIYVDDMFAKKI